MQVQTKIARSKTFDKQLDKVPDFILKKYMFWVFLVETNGIAETARTPGFHDEPLKGDRGPRSH